MPERVIRMLPDGSAIARCAAAELIRVAAGAVRNQGRFTLVLAGGSTPKALYRLLIDDAALRAALPWDKMGVFFGDERHVGPEHPDSNYRMARDAMLSAAPLKPEQILRIKGEDPDAEHAAREYELELQAYFQLKDDDVPRFDLVLLGMGNDGHTLSLFPGTEALHETERMVTHNRIDKLSSERITLTAPTVNNAVEVIFMVVGAEKAPALRAVLEGPYEPEQFPAQLIRPMNGRLLWLVDAAAGALLSDTNPRGVSSHTESDSL
ncbi:MAG TPA: 6-phosphogluconolactonase [Bryobacteraceae bacterium]|nr:6-phosphogluconolactonase [Bryobacteraceae bacterium]